MTKQHRIIVYIESNEKKEILPVSLEAISIGKRIFEKTGGELMAVVAGKNIEQIAHELPEKNV